MKKRPKLSTNDLEPNQVQDAATVNQLWAVKMALVNVTEAHEDLTSTVGNVRTGLTTVKALVGPTPADRTTVWETLSTTAGFTKKYADFITHLAGGAPGSIQEMGGQIKANSTVCSKLQGTVEDIKTKLSTAIASATTASTNAKRARDAVDAFAQTGGSGSLSSFGHQLTVWRRLAGTSRLCFRRWRI